MNNKSVILIVVFLLLNVIPQQVFSQAAAELDTGIELFEAEKYPEAKEIFERLFKSDSDDHTAAFYLGRIFFQEQEYKKSIEWLEDAIELNSGSSEYYYWLGQSAAQQAQQANIFKKPGLASKSKKALLRSVELDENNLDARFFLMMFYLNAPGLFGGDKNKARDQAEEIKKRDDKRGRQAFANVYRAEEKNELAIKEYESYIRDYPDEMGVYYELGYIYQNEENYDKAFETFENCLKNNPGELGAYYQIGRTAVFSKTNLGRGVECYKYYLKQQPGPGDVSLASAHWRLGMIYEIMEKKDLARQEYEAALNLEPDNDEAKKALKKLK